MPVYPDRSSDSQLISSWDHLSLCFEFREDVRTTASPRIPNPTQSRPSTSHDSPNLRRGRAGTSGGSAEEGDEGTGRPEDLPPGPSGLQRRRSGSPEAEGWLGRRGRRSKPPGSQPRSHGGKGTSLEDRYLPVVGAIRMYGSAFTFASFFLAAGCKIMNFGNPSVGTTNSFESTNVNRNKFLGPLTQSNVLEVFRRSEEFEVTYGRR